MRRKRMLMVELTVEGEVGKRDMVGEEIGMVE